MEMEKIVFKDWLDERGLLSAFCRNRLNALGELDDNRWILRLDPGFPVYWLSRSFHFDTGMPGGRLAWSTAYKDWRLLVGRPDVQVEAGIPLNDRLGLTLMLAELEEDDGENKLP